MSSILKALKMGSCGGVSLKFKKKNGQASIAPTWTE
jgi:hypothetical protein